MKRINLFKHFSIIVAAIGSLIMLCSYAPSNTTTNHDNEDLELLKMVVREMQSELPLDIEDGMSISEVYVTNTHFVMEYTCPNNFVEMLRLGMDNNSKAEFIKNMQVDESSTLLLNICVDAGVGARFIFTNKSYSNQVRIEYSVDELRHSLK
jgi:hypothetical protein